MVQDADGQTWTQTTEVKGKDMQEMLNRDAVFGGLLIFGTLKAMVDRIIRMARLVSLLIER